MNILIPIGAALIAIGVLTPGEKSTSLPITEPKANSVPPNDDQESDSDNDSSQPDGGDSV